MKKSVLKFDTAALKKAMFDNLVPLQTARFVEYAKNTILEIGNQIQTYHSRHHMDRTGNLLNSLCWGVSYRGELMASGFYRPAVIHGSRNGGRSYLHEWHADWEAFPVNGRELAQKYIKQYGHIFTEGWRVFFAILAPYWGYWEAGFTFKGRHKQAHLQFAVMTQFYDTITSEMKPARVTFKTKPAPYVKSFEIKGRNGLKVKIEGTIERRGRNYRE